ncbi:MAG: MFS transporter [Gammaproteobacteria bacterium]
MSTAGGASGAIAESAGTLPSRQAWYLVFALTVCNIIATVDRMAMTVLVTPMQQSLGLSDTDTGLIGGLVLGLFYALAGLPIAHYADRLNRRNLICIALVLWSAMTALCGLAVGFWSLFLARVAVAVFDAALSPAGTAMLADAFPANALSRPLSVFAIGSSLGNTLAAVLTKLFLVLSPLVFVGVMWDGQPLEPWRGVFFGLAVLGVIPLVLLLLAPEPPRREAATGHAFLPEMLGFLRHIGGEWRSYLPCYLGYTLMVLPLVCIAFWTPTAYERLYGVPSPTAGMWMGIGYIAFGITGTLGGGWLADRWDRRGMVDGKLRVLLVAALGLAPFAVAAQFMPTMWSALPCLFVAMFFAGMGLGPISAAVQVMTPTALRARAAAVLYLIVNLIAFAGIPLAGAVTDYVFGDPNRVNLSLAAITVVFEAIAVALVVWGLPHFRRQMEAVSRR